MPDSVTQILHSGPPGLKKNIAVLGDGFAAGDQTLYNNKVGRRSRRRRYVRWRTDPRPRARDNFWFAPERLRGRPCLSRAASLIHHRVPITEAGHVRQWKRIPRS